MWSFNATFGNGLISLVLYAPAWEGRQDTRKGIKGEEKERRGKERGDRSRREERRERRRKESVEDQGRGGQRREQMGRQGESAIGTQEKEKRGEEKLIKNQRRHQINLHIYPMTLLAICSCTNHFNSPSSSPPVFIFLISDVKPFQGSSRKYPSHLNVNTVLGRRVDGGQSCGCSGPLTAVTSVM